MGFWLRVGASLIDTFFLFAIAWPLLVWIYVWAYFGLETLIAGPADLLLSWVFPAIACIFLWIHKRATPGTMADVALSRDECHVIVYWRDKDAANAREWRVQEVTLHGLVLLGGWPGALIAQQQFRHKTIKGSFQVSFWKTVLLNVAGMAFLVHQGWAQALSKTLFGP